MIRIINEKREGEVDDEGFGIWDFSLPKGFSDCCTSSPSPEWERERDSEWEQYFFVVAGVKERVSEGGRGKF